MFSYTQRHGTAGDARTLVVLLHGYDQDEHLFDTLLTRLPQENVDYVCVRAPHSLGRDAYCWFPLITAPEFSLGPVIDVCDELIEWLAGHRTRYDRIVLAGFSQGAEAASSVLRHRPDLVDGLVMLSGILIDLPDPYFRDALLTDRTVPTFFGTDEHDGVLPQELLTYAAGWLDRHAAPQFHSYPGMGHRIGVTEAEDLARFLMNLAETPDASVARPAATADETQTDKAGR